MLLSTICRRNAMVKNNSFQYILNNSHGKLLLTPIAYGASETYLIDQYCIIHLIIIINYSRFQ